MSTLPLPPLPLLDGTTLQVSASTLSMMQSCPMMAAWKLLWKRQSARSSSMAADAGKAFHVALQTRSEGRQAAFSDTLLAKATFDMQAAYDGIEVPPDDHRTFERMAEVLRAYREQYPTDPWQVLATELPFAVPLGSVIVYGQLNRSVDIVYRGLIDLLVRWDNEVLVVDRKTSEKWSPTTLIGYKMSGQFRSYAWVIQELHRSGLVKELPAVVHGALVDAIVIRKPTKTGKSKYPQNEFHRERYYYSQQALDEWRTNALGTVRSWLQQYADGRFVMNTGTCANVFGRQCQYLDVCSLPIENRITMIGCDQFTDILPGPLDQPTEPLTTSDV